MRQGRAIPEATIVSKEDEVAPSFLIKNSNSFETSSSVMPGRIKFKICVNAGSAMSAASFNILISDRSLIKRKFSIAPETVQARHLLPFHMIYRKQT